MKILISAMAFLYDVLKIKIETLPDLLAPGLPRVAEALAEVQTRGNRKDRFLSI